MIVVLAALGFASEGRAAELYDMNRVSVRALGMGNAASAIVTGHDALFYNPAAVAENGGVSWRIFELTAGAVDLMSLQSLMDLQSSSGFADALRELYGKNVWLGGHLKSSLMLPFVTVAYYDTFDVSLRVDDPSVPEVSANVVNDMGLAIGFGAPILPVMSIGGVVKRIDRMGTRSVYGASTIGGLDPGPIMDDVQRKGVGYSLDLGTKFSFPGPVSPGLSFVWRNVGNTSFKGGVNAPPSEEAEMLIGATLDINAGLVAVRPAFDYRYLNRSDVQITKKINFGVEVDLPILDLRAGFHQGYYTGGLGFNLGLVNLDIATYGVEMGEFAGQKEDRRYMLSLSMELGIDLGLGGGGSSSSGASGSGSRSGSTFGGKKLKQRR